MAKNIVLKNALGDNVVYEKIGKIVLKDDSGANIEYVEKPASPDVVEYVPNSYLCRVIDIDGTVLKAEYLAFGEVFALPSPEDLPTHEGLVFDGYSSPIEIIDNTVTVDDQNLTVGIVYTTSSGLSEFDIELTPKTGLSVTLNVSDGDISWGDGYSQSITQATSHTYSNYGKYTITWSGTTMNTHSGNGIFGQNSSTYNYYCTDVRFANITQIGSYAFFNCNSLRGTTIPMSVNTINTGAFDACKILEFLVIPPLVEKINSQFCMNSYLLKNVILPHNINNIDGQAFSYCHSLNDVYIPKNVTNIGNKAFERCYGLSQIIIPSGVESIGSYAFDNCTGLTCDIIIPDSVKTIGQNAFSYCYGINRVKMSKNVGSIPYQLFVYNYGVVYYDFTSHTSIPTLNSNGLTGLNYISKIYVPDNLYDSWKTATNWSAWSAYIYKASDMPAE